MDLSGSKMTNCATISVCTKDKNIHYTVPSVFNFPNEDFFHMRRNLKMKNLVQTANRVSSYVSRVPKVENKFSSSVRRVIASLISQLRRHPKNHFTSKELAVLLQMYYTITEYRVRYMTEEEFYDFLKKTLGITDLHVLKGLKRIAVQPFGSKVGELSGIPPIRFMTILSVYLRGNLEEKAEMAFKIMDIDQDGMLRMEYEFSKLLSRSFLTKIAAPYPDIDPNQPVRDSSRYLHQVFNLGYETGVNMKRFKEAVLQQPWLIDCLLPITCQDVSNINVLFSLSV